MITLDYIVDGTDEKKMKSGSAEKDLRFNGNENNCHDSSFICWWVHSVLLIFHFGSIFTKSDNYHIQIHVMEK